MHCLSFVRVALTQKKEEEEEKKKTWLLYIIERAAQIIKWQSLSQ